MDKWAPIIIGAMLGTFAHFGIVIAEEGWPRLRSVVGYLMQLGFIILLAGAVTDQFKITNDLWQSMTAACLALSVREVIPWLRSRAQKVLEALGFKL